MNLSHSSISSPFLKPGPLLEGGTIGIVSPAWWLDGEELKRAGAVFEQAGYHLIWGESNQSREYHYAGSPELRTRDLVRMFADPKIDAILCARGGYGGFQIGDQLDYELIRSHPKIFMGFSDITGLLLSITQKTGLVTFHGPMLHTFRNGPEPLSFRHLEAVLSGHARIIDLSSLDGIKVLRDGTGRGNLWGGNLYLFTIRIGTPLQVNTSGNILFVEDTGEALRKLESMFQQLRRSGSLENITGLIVGEVTDIPEDEYPFGRSLDEIVLEACDGLDIPIITGVPCGHGQSILTFPVSLPVELKADHNQVVLDLLEPAVEA